VEAIALRVLRNDTAATLRRVEAGESLVITVDRRPVAALVPLPRRDRWVRADVIWSRLSTAQADVELRAELDEAFADRIDDL